ncbi:uncharacterized protein Z518_08052 [Rhinocladiella mackenziei CBS 650.93]|uniref:Rhinocladiella mackenziei CBS 650.93 unplaced genomic scaffold supercont1.6, whole genome shotgun sequence n=1 Tax=Rhinocladiella mackenziei CBS 650.93 TaxID=1442369 RepID=A0A0D2GV14_9EURO|nr:uncharacterized protein Z518_08052 [Rhinocladiella mackenziei CBS 650.93]KIX02113.1 hypothetical protein Z518_08052 [Rhinocladiella mackenziei CBS 650.93]
MAMPGHSPPFSTPSSPPRSFNGYSEPPGPPTMYGPPSRPMLPPSPQHFPPRFSQPSLPVPSPAIAANNGPPPPHKRPGSSMSISSMLGTEPEKPVHEQYHNHSQPSRTRSRQPSLSGPSMTLGVVMSPPQYPSKPNTNDYSYKSRSKTPDRVTGTTTGGRPHRSSSGTMTQRPGPFYESAPPTQPAMNTFPDAKYTPPFGPTATSKEDYLEDHGRRTSISGILQRPESQPQPSTVTSTFPTASNPPTRPESIPPSPAQVDRPIQPPINRPEPPRSNSHVGPYDTRPPTLPRLPQATSVPQTGPAQPERPLPQSLSPELRRLHLSGNDNRGLAGILNQQPEPVLGAQNMMRQDSVQSQSDRSVLGDRMRNRAYSPFASSTASQTFSTVSGPLDDQLRKGTDELSQHRAILGLANESKRGRYSPLPQAVQGAQAQTPVPDAGIKTEHGRVFSGIGSGLGSASAGPTPTPQPLPASPFKRDEGGSRLSEENLMKMSRSASGISKRNRKALDDEVHAESDVGDVKKSGPGRGKRSKYQHSYKLDLEDATLGHRTSSPFATSNPIRRAATPTSNPPQLVHHHQLPRQPSVLENTPTFRPKRTIRISSVVALARRNPRRHLGFFKYNPILAPVDLNRPTAQKFDVSIRPNLLPSFTDAEHINCTYTVRVPRQWIQQRERGIICAERYLWGSGIYTDDSDPIAAAMHSGFITSVHPPGIDEALLARVIEEQNPRIEGSMAPEKPKPMEENKDLHITLLVLPQLEEYVESVRFGIKSRSWPEEPDPSPPTTSGSRAAASSKTPHDGVSFMVLKTEFVNDGTEVKRVGRTGKEKRERLRREIMERKRGLELEKQRIAMAEMKVRERQKELKPGPGSGSKKANSKGLEITNSTSGTMDKSSRNSKLKDAADGENLPPDSQEQENENENGTSTEDMMKLDVGQSPGDWIRQLAVATA